MTSSTKQINRPKPIHKFHSDSSAPQHTLAHRIIIRRNRSYTLYLLHLICFNNSTARPLLANRPLTKIHSKYTQIPIHTNKDESISIAMLLCLNDHLSRTASMTYSTWHLYTYIIFVCVQFLFRNCRCMLLKATPTAQPLTTWPYQQRTAYHSAIQFFFFVYLTVIV